MKKQISFGCHFHYTNYKQPFPSLAPLVLVISLYLFKRSADVLCCVSDELQVARNQMPFCSAGG